MKNLSKLRNRTVMLVRGLGRAAWSGNAPAENRQSRSIGGRIRASLRSGSAGQALVEMAVAFPIMLTLTTGMLIFGLAVNQYIMLTEATATGAKYESLQRGNTTNPCLDVYTQVSNAAPTLLASQMTFTLTITGTGDSPATNTYGPYKGSAMTCSATSTSTGSAGELLAGGNILVEVQYPCSLSSYKLPIPSCTLQSEIAEVVQ
ncbi:MAG: TadE/TadG family type IV pilus assembly protein [Terracidiphilus sp.]|jgi:Flp pilus assembly protein TadG